MSPPSPRRLAHLTAIPLPPSAPAFPGALYRSPMPFRHDDGELLDEALEVGVRAIVWLTGAPEAIRKARHDLAGEYVSRGLGLIHVPIEDFSVPTDPVAFEGAVESAIDRLGRGDGVLVHCAAGLGRTGMFLACLVGRVSELGAASSIDWVRRFVFGAVETEAQREIVEGFVRR